MILNSTLFLFFDNKPSENSQSNFLQLTMNYALFKKCSHHGKEWIIDWTHVNFQIYYFGANSVIPKGCMISFDMQWDFRINVACNLPNFSTIMCWNLIKTFLGVTWNKNNKMETLVIMAVRLSLIVSPGLGLPFANNYGEFFSLFVKICFYICG